MAEFVEDSERLMIPRWRPFRVAASLGQLDAAFASRVGEFPIPSEGETEALVTDWVHHRTPIHAANLVDAALMLGNSDLGRDAASWLIANGGVSDVSIELAREVLAPTSSTLDVEPPIVTKEMRFKRVAGYRRRLRRHPRDPLLWVDLAREYSALGQIGQANRALSVAIGLAPNDRFVLRSASRFFLHTNDAGKAHDILRRSQSIVHDPWLVSAEIVAAEASGRRSMLVKVGGQLVGADRFSARSVSELASSIGTLEHKAGNRRNVRRLFGRALEDPTENTVAQAAWIGRHMSGFDVPESSFMVPRAFEAQTWGAVQVGDYHRAVELAWAWLNDEPFATQPALFGAWVTTNAVGDYRTGIRFAEAAMVANPDDTRLLAELVYCRASLNELDEARNLLPRLIELAGRDAESSRAGEWEVVIEADRGLLAYRAGDSGNGFVHYGRAMALANQHDLKVHFASAYLNHIRERVRAVPGLVLDNELIAAAIEAFPVGQRAVMTQFVERIDSQRVSKTSNPY